VGWRWSNQLKRGLSTHRVIVTGVVLIIAQLVFRGWAVFGSWFQFDDFAFMSRLLNKPLSEALLEPYAGHVMPAGMLASWLNIQVDPLDFTLPAATLLAMQALASFGCLVLLVSAFGQRWGVLPPLAIYLFTVISLPAFIWWAAGINQLPLQIAFFWGLVTHLAYLRTRRLKYAVLTMLITIAALAFYEKSVLLFGVFGIIALAYFATGDIGDRLRLIWQRYRGGIVLYSAVAVAYLGFYAVWGLNFDPGGANDHPLVPVVYRMAAAAFATGVLGGPLRWEYPTELFAIADPPELLIFVAGASLVALGLEATRTRRRSKRAWLVPGFLLAADILLVAAGRAAFVGPQIAQDYRYQTELAAAAAFALGLSLLPLRGADESVETIRPSALFDNRFRSALVTVAVASLGTVSSLQYIDHWQSDERSRKYFATVERELTEWDGRVPLADSGVPDYLMWAFGFPENTTSHVLRMFDEHMRFPRHTTDELYMIGRLGNIVPAVLPETRRHVPLEGPRCGYEVDDEGVTRVPLDGPVVGGGWWVRIGYVADGDSPMTVVAGDLSHEVHVREGLHSVFVQAAGEFDTLELGPLDDGVALCTNDVTLGLPEPYEPR
jgi:hypothetical protein